MKEADEAVIRVADKIRRYRTLLHHGSDAPVESSEIQFTYHDKPSRRWTVRASTPWEDMKAEGPTFEEVVMALETKIEQDVHDRLRLARSFTQALEEWNT